MIGLDAARQLIDFGARLGDESGPRAEEQLKGAVAIANMLARHKVAYLADEVGMGKTYVALGAAALMRHFKPDLRLLVIAPRANIQSKWMKEFSNFVANNVRFDDLRVRSLGGRPARPHVLCDRLLDLVAETAADPNRDFFMRLTSFSLPLSRQDCPGWAKLSDRLLSYAPWVDPSLFDPQRHTPDSFKVALAKALCCALPHFDLVIVDEGHNLKHGYSEQGSSRNQVLAHAMGRIELSAEERRHFPGYGRRAEHVLFLSATPVEDNYRQLYNQLDLFGMGDAFAALRGGAQLTAPSDENEASSAKQARTDAELPPNPTLRPTHEDVQKAVAGKFLVRRVTSLNTAGEVRTKNLYRREWRGGGVVQFDDPISVRDPRQRLVVALVQKKVSELLADHRFKHSFQIGMLASFESFLQTAGVAKSTKRKLPKKSQPADRGDETSEDSEASGQIFDDAAQTDDALERQGIDVGEINQLATDYRTQFGHELPHPKMDAVVDRLDSAWTTGRKSLVFVRRVASVKELKRKLDERYDAWLIPHVRERLPSALHVEFDAVVERYQQERLKAREAVEVEQPDDTTPNTKAPLDDEDDAVTANRGGTDSFFAWYFRGDGPTGVVSGADIQQRFIKRTGAYSVFFADNHVQALLGAPAGRCLEALASCFSSLDEEELQTELSQRAKRYLKEAARVTPQARFEAAQAAAVELLGEHAGGDLKSAANVVWQERYEESLEAKPTTKTETVADALDWPTFFSELQRPAHEPLRRALWPVERQIGWGPDFRERFRRRVLRAELLASSARLGHAFIDLYVTAMSGRATLSAARESGTGPRDHDVRGERLMRQYIALLEKQQGSRHARSWGAFDELSEIAEHFELIVDTNLPDARDKPLSALARYISGLSRQQQPVGGMSGKVNGTLVRQFRMPGYPLVLVTTDLLQEGEDLHTFCSSVMHYGISWTPSSMEQRIGRIDRVRSQTERRLSGLQHQPNGEDLLQVYYPYLQDTVEIFQVERVLERMNTFLRLMHEGLRAPGEDQQTVNLRKELLGPRRRVQAPTGVLQSAFPIPQWALRGEIAALKCDSSQADELRQRFAQMGRQALDSIVWKPVDEDGHLLGTIMMDSGHVQDFALRLDSTGGRGVVRCMCPIGQVATRDEDQIAWAARGLYSRLTSLRTLDDANDDLHVEDNVLLGAKEHDAARVTQLIVRVARQATELVGACTDFAGLTYDRRETALHLRRRHDA